ncbi:MAG: acyltransferase [Muribaculum sp.]|nr:acyltransferase [Muribaculum sp.]
MDGRKKNLEELRCLAMMMVVVLHFLGKGELLGDVTAPEMSAAGLAAWVLEAFCIVAVDVYMLISGYLLCESSFKPSRLIRLYLQVWMYSVGIGLAAGLGGLTAGWDTHDFLTLLFPVSMGHYWFMTAYVFLYLFLPFVGAAVRQMTKEQLKLALIILLLAFCVLKSVLPFRLEEDRMGYDCLWYLCVFLAAAYIRKFGVLFLEKRWRCGLLYAVGCAALLAELLALRTVYLHTGSLGLILKISMEYNHVFVFLAAVGLFGWFLHGKGAGVVGRIAAQAGPYVLGVYLFHEHMALRYEWMGWFGAGNVRTVPELLAKTAAAVVCMFVTGVIIEWLRSFLMVCLGRLFSGAKWWKIWMEKLAQWDCLFAQTEE